MSADPAARAYRAVVAGLDGAADELRAADRERVVELTKKFRTLDENMLRAESRAEDTMALADALWNVVIDTLWGESWMTLRPRPEPPPFPPERGLDAYDIDLQRAAAAVAEAVRRRRFGLPGR